MNNLNHTHIVNKSLELLREVQFNILMSEDHEPHICRHFGCGRILTMEEKLYGDQCIKHSKQGRIVQSGRCYPCYY